MHFKLSAGAALLALCFPAAAGSWRADFANPPASAQPRVWWHWMNGNISQEGIRLDLEWMKRVGVGGVQAFDGNLNTPQIVPERHVFMSDVWRKDMAFAGAEAKRLGLEMAVASSGGWSLAGGPWVKPEQAMKKLVWSETAITGGKRVAVKLAPPPSVAGPYQDIPASMTQAHGGHEEDIRFYRDSRVVAYPSAPKAAGAPPSASTSQGPVDQRVLSDGMLAAGIALPVTPGGDASWLRFDYAEPRPIHAITIAVPSPRGFGAPPSPVIAIEASEDGERFTPVATVSFGFGAGVQQTVSFEPRTARAWRLLVKPEAGGAPPVAPGVILPPFGSAAKSYLLTEVRLHEQARIHRHEEKAGFGAAPDYYALATPPAPAGSALAPASVIDLSAALRPDGTLEWDAPAGEWTVLRMGYSLTGHQNGPAAPEATGLEVDKLSAVHTNSYLDHYLGLHKGNAGITALLNDSIESGAQNWTEDMPAAFRQRRGYALEPWLPALTGQLVGSAQDSDRFLWDFRRTIAELLSERFYGTMASQARARGLTLYGEALEDRRPQLGDDLEMRRHAAIPMAAMWTVPAGGSPRPSYVADVRGAASVAHVWGQNLVAAESMTAFGQPWAFSPRDLKATADLEFALGVNRIVIHTSPHQPLVEAKPGLSLAPFLGQYFARTDTWAEQAKPWVSYLARNSLMLQQGSHQADIAYFHGEEAPVTGLYGEKPNADVPSGYAYDYVNTEALRQRFSVQGGALATPNGGRYRLLYLGGTSRRMTLGTLERIAQLVRDGATLVGDAPEDSPSLANDAQRHARLKDSLWNAQALAPEGRKVGKGRVLSGRTLSAALNDLAIAPDFRATGPLAYVHRRAGQDDIYYVSNSGGASVKLDASFRVQGKQAEFWHADSGTRSPASYRAEGGRTTVPLALEAHESVFVVFSGKAASTGRVVAPVVERPLAVLADGWRVRFQEGRGAPEEELAIAPGSLTASDIAGVRYFSGTASYSRQFNLSAADLAGGGVALDLGDVRDIAQVLVNGKDLGITWKPPYRYKLGGALRAGMNTLEVRVTNPWVNRLIGDAQPGAQKVTSGTGPVYAPDAPLRPSGLIGPVTLNIVQGQE